MFPGINPSQMKSMMKQMGIKPEEINAKRVIIEKDSGRFGNRKCLFVQVLLHGQ